MMGFYVPTVCNGLVVGEMRLLVLVYVSVDKRMREGMAKCNESKA